jgi:hypothetical protein
MSAIAPLCFLHFVEAPMKVSATAIPPVAAPAAACKSNPARPQEMSFW